MRWGNRNIRRKCVGYVTWVSGSGSKRGVYSKMRWIAQAYHAEPEDMPSKALHPAHARQSWGVLKRIATPRAVAGSSRREVACKQLPSTRYWACADRARDHQRPTFLEIDILCPFVLCIWITSSNLRVASLRSVLNA